MIWLMLIIFATQLYKLWWYIHINRKLDEFLAGQGVMNAANLDMAKAYKALSGSIAKGVKQTLNDVKSTVAQGVTDAATVAAQLAVNNASAITPADFELRVSGVLHQELPEKPPSEIIMLGQTGSPAPST